MMVAALFCSMAAFGALSLAMDGHHRDVFGRTPSPRRAKVLRLTGWLLLALTLLLSASALGWPKGAVLWVGLLTVGACAQLLWLAYRPRWVGMVLLLAGTLGLLCTSVAV
ncbi:DUF3325 domain-containing protein [Chitinolyticbacter meiyuanensis]|uniref:DUF3325 domain-containing protein n=1 Tax=Chitinolyticbacter meiyuanensis TaxID=682798 RepID=UPI0011E5B05D|nr:DUF3325 domain-containing protein [Chitinolyticbacter meiyuanensis]